MDAGELFQAGRLGDAIAAAIQEVKDQPGDLSRRTLLFALLCFEGDLDRAGKQLVVVENQAALTEAPLYAGLIAAEQTRRKVLFEGLPPKFFSDPPPRIMKHVEALEHLRNKRFAEAHSVLDQAEDERPEIAGILNGTSFDDFADADDITRSVFEFQQGREYYWAPFEQIQHLQIVMPDPVRPRDLYWAPCQIMLKSGGVQRGFTPVLYADSHRSSDSSIKLGHQTTFQNVGGDVFRGVGRKQFVAGDQDPTPFDLKDLSFN